MEILDIFITEYCNLSCSYCSSTNNVKSFISLEELKNIDYSKHSVINILGGEPLIHPEILDILAYYNSELFKNKTIIVYTNGLYISKLNFKNYTFDNLNFLLTFHLFNNSIEDIYNYTQKHIFYKNIRYQMLYTKSNINDLKKFNTHYLASKIILGYDIYLKFDIKDYVHIKNNFKNFNLEAIDLMFKKNESDMIRYTSLIQMTNKKTPRLENHEGFQFCLLKYHFEWN